MTITRLHQHRLPPGITELAFADAAPKPDPPDHLQYFLVLGRHLDSLIESSTRGWVEMMAAGDPHLALDLLCGQGPEPGSAAAVTLFCPGTPSEVSADRVAVIRHC